MEPFHLIPLCAVVIELTPGTVVAICGCITGVAAVIALMVKFVRWIDHQKDQDTELKALQEKHDEDMKELKAVQEKQMNQLQHELSVICYGVRGALQGLIENGCNGPCKKALSKLDKHLNLTAHDEVTK